MYTISSLMASIMWLWHPLTIMPASLSDWWTMSWRGLFLLRRWSSVRIGGGGTAYRWGSCPFIGGRWSPFVTWWRRVPLNRRTWLRWGGMMSWRYRRMMLSWWWSRPEEVEIYKAFCCVLFELSTQQVMGKVHTMPKYQILFSKILIPLMYYFVVT